MPLAFTYKSICIITNIIYLIHIFIKNIFCLNKDNTIRFPQTPQKTTTQNNKKNRKPQQVYKHIESIFISQNIKTILYNELQHQLSFLHSQSSLRALKL